MEALHGVFHRCFGVAADAWHDQLAQVDVARWDSAGHLDLIMDLERSFGIEITLEQALQLRSVPAIAALLGSHGVDLGHASVKPAPGHFEATKSSTDLPTETSPTKTSPAKTTTPRGAAFGDAG